jgi:UDP-N-acetylmuramyl tripeptide synthase
VNLPSAGLHYAIDAALAIGMAEAILAGEFDLQTAGTAISESLPVYGRGEKITYRGQEIHVIMMKNLPSLQANLDALQSAPECVWISVDEGTPDPSWIYDIDLVKLSEVQVISGTKTFQWATRLAYAGVPYGELIEDESKALEYFLKLPGTRKTAIINYEQMMWLRKKLGLLDLEGSLE